MISSFEPVPFLKDKHVTGLVRLGLFPSTVEEGLTHSLHPHPPQPLHTHLKFGILQIIIRLSDPLDQFPLILGSLEGDLPKLRAGEELEGFEVFELRKRGFELEVDLLHLQAVIPG